MDEDEFTKYIFRCDYKTKQVINECHLNPTEIKQEDQHWLWAINNKYDDDVKSNDNRTGKWMLFLAPDYVNSVWLKIKNSVKDGNLWQSKVSTKSPDGKTHAIMIYTKDYADLEDVINVLDYLEASGIKSANSVIKYKTDQQTYAGIYSGGKQRPWIYSSDTVRQQN